jgi:GNAT superfamily N-acetyltransferase
VDIPIAVAEGSEAETLLDFESGAPAEARAALGLNQVRIGGGVALSMRNDPINYWSKALGFGFDTPVTADLIAEIGEFYRVEGTSSAEILLAPSVLPEDWPEISAKAELTIGARWAKLACAVDVAARATAAPTRIEVTPVSGGDAQEWATTLLRGYGTPADELVGMFAALVDRPGWLTFAGRLDGRIVSTGALHVNDRTGHCFGGATLPEARGLGAQSALLAARSRAAQEAGCQWLVAETGAEEPGGHNSSLHNMLRLGFTVRYERHSWILRAGR